jgi:hypothetical protein
MRMPHLLCDKHGREQEAATRKHEELYQQEGETVLIVKGTLISGPWHCDRCNAVLKKGQPAILLMAYPRWMTEGMTDYDFLYESRYFATGKAEVAVYGADWPGVVRALAEQAEADG